VLFMPGIGSGQLGRVWRPDGRNMYGPCGSSMWPSQKVGSSAGSIEPRKLAIRPRRPPCSWVRIAGRPRRAPGHQRGGQIDVAASTRRIA
jgi:hypothetical protein